MSFNVIRSKSLIARSLRPIITYTLCEILFLAPVANVAFADETKVVIENVLNDAISQTQNMVVSMSQGCSGGAHGVPPVNWSGLQENANLAIDALKGVKSALTSGQTTEARQQLQFAGKKLDVLVNGVHNNCSGGASGVDPVYYDRYQAIRAAVRAKLDVVGELLK
jgi:hypothetical protein